MNGKQCTACGHLNDPRETVCRRCGSGFTASAYVDAVVNATPSWSAAPGVPPPAPYQMAGPHPGQAEQQAIKDEEHLKLLSIGHYVLGAIVGLFACIPIIHLVLGLGFLFAGAFGGGGPEALVGGLFVLIGASVIAIGWAIALAIISAGRFIKQRRRHTFCVVVACLSCLWMPLGTILGVFSLIVLLRPSVKELFARG